MRVMPLWQSAQALFPTNVAPGMSGAEKPEVEEVEQEFTNRIPLPVTARQIAPMMIRAVHF